MLIILHFSEVLLPKRREWTRQSSVGWMEQIFMFVMGESGPPAWQRLLGAEDGVGWGSVHVLHCQGGSVLLCDWLLLEPWLCGDLWQGLAHETKNPEAWPSCPEPGPTSGDALLWWRKPECQPGSTWWLPFIEMGSGAQSEYILETGLETRSLLYTVAAVLGAFKLVLPRSTNIPLSALFFKILMPPMLNNCW